MPNIPDIFNGCYIFPCVAGAKVPAIEGGWKNASADPAQWGAWEWEFPGCNWAVATGLSDLFVIDIDPQGLETWERMQNDVANLRAQVEQAFTVRTPRGGLHHYWRGSGPSTASRIAAGIDTRGGIRTATGDLKSGGYVLLPGSRTDAGVYSEIGGSIGPLPALISSLIPERKKAETHGLERDPGKDQPRNVQWAISLLQGYVKEGRVSIEGKGGNDTAFRVAASILDKAISPALCLDLLGEHWNPHCSPPWDDWELERIVANAAAYGEETEGGSKGFQSNADAFANFQGKGEPEPEERDRRRFRPMWLAEARKDRRPAKWLIPNVLPAEGTGILYGLSGSYKTFVALDWALCLAHGVPGQWGAPPVKHVVLYLAGESSYALRQERVDAWCEHHGLDPDAAQFVFVHGVPAYGDTEGWQEIRDGLAELNVQPELIVIDTLTREMTGLSENSNDEAKLVLKFNEEMAHHYGCMVLAIGHTGKDQSKGMRGAQVFIDNSDAVLFLKKRAGGVTLKPQKLKEVDTDDTVFYLQVKDSANSIVLEKVEALAEEPRAGKSRIDWSSPKEVTAILNSAGGSLSLNMLAAEIAKRTGADAGTIRRRLAASEELKYLRNGNNWELPKQEYDL